MHLYSTAVLEWFSLMAERKYEFTEEVIVVIS